MIRRQPRSPLFPSTTFSRSHVSKSQTISQIDTTDPVINGVGADGTVQCPVDPTTAFSNPTASDTCDANVVLTHSDVTNQLACGKSVTRTWTARDCSSTHVSKSQTISQIDTTDPVINGVGADGTVQCPVDPTSVFLMIRRPARSTLFPFTTLFRSTNQLACGKSVTRTWTATDCSSNHVSK